MQLSFDSTHFVKPEVSSTKYPLLHLKYSISFVLISNLHTLLEQDGIPSLVNVYPSFASLQIVPSKLLHPSLLIFEHSPLGSSLVPSGHSIHSLL